ncbi:MAG TPA: hypothetical protein VIO56_06750 [Methylotenera sp.]
MKNLLLNAYFAGLIDGEGTIGVYKFSSGITRPIIKVDMTCEDTINALHSHFGGYKGLKKIEDKPNRKQQWHWEVTFLKAVEVANLIFPYLITKKSNAIEVIAYTPKKRGRPKLKQ